MMEIITIPVPIKWKMVKLSPKSMTAKTIVINGVPETIAVPFEVPKYDNTLYQQYNEIP